MQFKLNPNVQFEMDIGDSCMVNEQQMERQRYEGQEDEYYEEQDMMQKPHSNGQYEQEYIGDCARNDNRKHITKIKKQYSDIGNSQMALYMAELERKINSKSSKKRHKSKQQSNGSSSGREVKSGDYMQVDTYMANMEESSQESPNNDTDSEGEKTESTTRAQSDSGNDNGNGMPPMKVFMRRTTHYEEDEEELIDDKDAVDQIVSPRSVYLEMQRKKNEKNH